MQVFQAPAILLVRGPLRPFARPAEVEVNFRGAECLLESRGRTVGPARLFIGVFTLLYQLPRPTRSFGQRREGNLARANGSRVPVHRTQTVPAQQDRVRVDLAVNHCGRAGQERPKPGIAALAQVTQPRKASLQRARKSEGPPRPSPEIRRVVALDE